MTDPDPSPAHSGAVASLNGLRGIAALWVMAFHYFWAVVSAGRAPSEGLWLLRDGWAAVDLFFILSGFVLMRGYGAGFARPTAAGLLAYARARVLRIYPVSTAVLLGLLALTIVDQPLAAWLRSQGPGYLSLGSFLRTLTLTTQWTPPEGFFATQWQPVANDWNPPIWSLSVELVGYAVLPVVAWRLARIATAVQAAMIAGLLLVTMLYVQLQLGFFGYNMPAVAAGFVRMGFGFTAGACLSRAATLAPAAWARRAPVVALLAVATIVALTFATYGAALMGPPFAALIFALSFRRGVIDRLLSSSVAQFFGRISFPLYLIHFIPGLAYNRQVGIDPAVGDTAFFVGFAGLIASVILAAWLCHRFVEAPAHRLARRWSRVPQAAARPPWAGAQAA